MSANIDPPWNLDPPWNHDGSFSLAARGYERFLGVDRHLLGPPLAGLPTAEFILPLVAGDAEQPGLEPGLEPEGADILIDPNLDILAEVFGLETGVPPPDEEAYQRVPATVVETTEESLVAGFQEGADKLFEQH